ncbi:trigger factor [Novosphingobium sp. MW5]|nr:trigger factor [Novosphingobium sp. MW5]
MPEEDAEKILAGDADLSFTMTYDVLPEFEIMDFSGIEIERPVVEIADEEVDQQIAEIAKNNTPFDTKDGPAGGGDGSPCPMSARSTASRLRAVPTKTACWYWAPASSSRVLKIS